MIIEEKLGPETLMRILLVAFILALLTYTTEHARADNASTHKKEQTSKEGNVTGGMCKADADCILGCVGKSDPTCVSKSEGSSKCLEGKSMPPGGLQCACLADVKLCGYRFPGVSDVTHCADFAASCERTVPIVRRKIGARDTTASTLK
jgi:hypothetical protein